MNAGDEPERSSQRDAYHGKHPLPPISLPLHEAVGLVLLYQRTPPHLIGDLKVDGVLYSFSAAYGYLRIREAIARLYDDEEALARVAADRAEIDQYQQQFVS